MKTQTFLTVTIALLSSLYMSFPYYTTVSKSSKEAYFASNYSAEANEDLEIEPWMTNDKLWKIQSETANKPQTFVGEEGDIEIEAWMTDDKLWRF